MAARLHEAPLMRASRELTLEAVRHVLEAVIERAAELGLAVNVAVVDRSGVPLAMLRMPGAFLASWDIALDKAYTAVGFGLPTGAWSDALSGHSSAVRHGLPARPRFVGFGGGLPIEIDGDRIGGIGVSGASESQDEDCARAGLRTIEAARYSHTGPCTSSYEHAP